MGDPLKPSASVLIKLGSAIVHADEAMSSNGTAVDEQTFRSLLNDPEVGDWLAEMAKLDFLPVKR